MAVPHITMDSFWVHIIHFGNLNTSFPISTTEGSKSEIKAGDFIRLLAAYPYVVNDKLWEEYYTEELMQSEDARTRIVLPDKKPLPSFVIPGKASSGQENKTMDSRERLLWRQRHGEHLRSIHNGNYKYFDVDPTLLSVDDT